MAKESARQRVLLETLGTVSGADLPLYDVRLKFYEHEGQPFRLIDQLISVDDLYPIPERRPSDVSNAFRLLDEADEHLAEALTLLRNGDVIGSDDRIQRLQAVLPELFCCRSIGDGFAAIINAVFHGLKNSKSDAVSEKQIQQIRLVLQRIRIEPFIDFQRATEQILKLEDVGFTVEPEEFPALADLLDE